MNSLTWDNHLVCLFIFAFHFRCSIICFVLWSFASFYFYTFVQSILMNLWTNPPILTSCLFDLTCYIIFLVMAPRFKYFLLRVCVFSPYLLYRCNNSFIKFTFLLSQEIPVSCICFPSPHSRNLTTYFETFGINFIYFVYICSTKYIERSGILRFSCYFNNDLTKNVTSFMLYFIGTEL